MKKLELALLIGFVGSVCCSGLAQAADSRSQLEENVLRLHILANSDSIDDQALKLKVRDAVLDDAAELLPGTDATLEETEETVQAHLTELEETARTVVQEEGYDYPVRAELTRMEFDDRTYGSLTMPAGEYDALRITIGEAAGQNWWCVMYPALCVPGACDVSEDGETETAYFDPSEQDLLEHPERYTVKLKCLEWLEKLREKWGNSA